MRYPHRFPPVEDIPNIGKKKIDINKLDRQMAELVRSVKFAVKKDDGKLSKDFPEIRSILEDFLRQFLITHNTIRIMLSRAYKKDDWAIVADTASLVREQIEKIYVIATILQDPKKWVRQYLRNAWRNDFERYLLQRDEFGELERHKEFLTEYYPTFLENQRRPPAPRWKRQKRTTTVSIFAKRCVKYNWYYPDGPKPGWYPEGKPKFKPFLHRYFYFPTPWDCVNSVKDETDYFKFLDRWYREYKFYSAYSHVLMDKLVLQHFTQYKSVANADKLKDYGTRKSHEVILTSSTVGATLCALIIPQVSHDFGAKKEAREFWEPLYGFYLLPKTLWNIYAEDLLA